MTTTDDRPRTVRQLQAHLANEVRIYGRGSAEAKHAEQVFWTAKLCAVLTDTITAHPLTDQQRRQIADVALTAGRTVTVTDQDGQRMTGGIIGSPIEPN